MFKYRSMKIKTFRSVDFDHIEKLLLETIPPVKQQDDLQIVIYLLLNA